MSLIELKDFFQKTLYDLKPGKNLAVAVSGGSDSMALLHLAKEYADQNQINLVALTVDHCLRKESKEEALFVQNTARSMGVAHYILRNDNEIPKTRVEETLRNIRYALLNQACKEHGCFDLLMGHHKNDLAETYLMRKAKKSTDWGLAGISVSRKQNGIRILRPLLSISSDLLRLYNQQNKQSWVTDPTNFSDDFERSRIRKTLTEAKVDQIFRECLSYAEKRCRVEAFLTNVIQDKVTISDLGYALFKRSDFLSLSDECQRLFLGLLMQPIGNKRYMPSMDQLKLLAVNLSDQNFKSQTLSGCLIAKTVKDQILILKELNDTDPPKIMKNETVFSWDRFTFKLSESFSQKTTIAPLNQVLETSLNIPKRCFYVLPAFFVEQKLFLVPHLGYKQTQVSSQVTFSPLVDFFYHSPWVCPKQFEG